MSPRRRGATREQPLRYTSELSFVTLRTAGCFPVTADADLLFLPKSPANLEEDAMERRARAGAGTGSPGVEETGAAISPLVVLPELAECIPLSSDAPLPRRTGPAAEPQRVRQTMARATGSEKQFAQCWARRPQRPHLFNRNSGKESP